MIPRKVLWNGSLMLMTWAAFLPAVALSIAAAAEPPAASQPASAPALRPMAMGPVTMDVPASWTDKEVKPGMRIGMAAWPRAAGDDADAEMIVFFFGKGGGGGIEPNMTRWRGQFVESTAPEGGDTLKFDGAAGVKVTLLDRTGTFKLTKGTMSAEFTPKADYRMLAAVVEIEGGPYFVRAVGPKASVAAQREALIAALKTFRAAK